MTLANAASLDVAALELVRQHREREDFAALQIPVPLADEQTAYAVQDAYVQKLLQIRGTSACGYKIALTTPAMRRMVNFGDSVSGRLLTDQIHRSGAAVSSRDYGRLIVEFELAFRIAANVPRTGDEWTPQTILPYVAAARPALEIADDRNANYSTLNQAILTLIADNAWNQGLVLGPERTSLSYEMLEQAEGIAMINGSEVGRGTGREVMGHPLAALAWLANHLQARGLRLTQGDVVTTGSLIASKFPVAGDRVDFSMRGFGEVTLRIEP